MAPKEKERICEECDEEFPTIAKFKDHKKYAHSNEKSAVCEHCGVSFKRVLDMRKHVNKIHRSKDDQISCEYCRFTTFSKISIKKHLVKNHTHHFVEKTELDSDEQFDDSKEMRDELLELIDEKGSKRNKGIEKLKCNICDVVLATVHALKCHIAFKHEKRRYRCHFTNCEFAAKRKSDLRKHEQIHKAPDQYPYKCRFCSYTSVKGHSLRNHMANHHGTNKIFQCEECDETFVFLGELKEHKKVKHSGESPTSPSNFQDEDSFHNVDDSLFRDDSNFDDYHPFTEDMSSIPSPKGVVVIKEDVIKNLEALKKKDQIQCSICCKNFNTQKHYYHHMLHSHIAGERRYCCKICGASYKRKENLIKHALENCLKSARNTNLNVAQMKLIGKFRCDLCGDQLKNLAAMGMHMESVHLVKDYKCDHPNCFYSTMNRLSLKVHKRTHTRKKEKSRFKCHHCSHVSKRRIALKMHSLKVHKIKEIYYCDQCNKGFQYQKALYEHHEEIHVENEESETSSDSDSDESIKSIESIEVKDENDEKAIIDIQIDVKEKDILATDFLDISNFKEVVKIELEVPSVNSPVKDEPEKIQDSDDEWPGGDDWGDDWAMNTDAVVDTPVDSVEIEACLIKEPDQVFKDGAEEKRLYPFKCPERYCKARLKTKELLEAHAGVHKTTLNFQCDICKQNFVSAEALTTHKSIKHTEDELERNFSCDQCQACFTSEVFLRNHSIYKHTEVRTFACKLCKYRGKMKGDLTKHLRIHSDPSKYPYKCYLCTYSTTNNQAIRIHMKNHHNTDNVYGCTHGKCKENFKYLKELKDHRLDAHSDYESEDENSKSDNNDVKSEIDIEQEKINGLEKIKVEDNLIGIQKLEKFKPKYQHECDICKMGFQYTEKFEKHRQSHIGEVRNHKCEECGGTFLNSTGLRLHKRKHITERLFKCLHPGCRFAGKTAALLKGHEVSHKEKSRACKYCLFTTGSIVALRKHMERKHNTEELFECNQCDQSFKWHTDFTDHQKAAHQDYLDSLKIKCDDCDYLALTVHLMGVHRRAHHDRVGPRLYPCTICGEVFVKSTKLKYHREVHIKTMRDESAKKRDQEAMEKGKPNIYYCDHCEKTWNNKFKIAKHMLDCHIHDPRICDHCGKIFNSTKRHRDHVRKVHDDKKKESQLCTLCGKTCRDNATLKRHHQRWHVQSKERACSDCDLTFKNMGLLNQHMSAKHRGVIRICPCGIQFRALSSYTNHVKACDKVPKDPAILNAPPLPKPMVPCTIEHCMEIFTHKISLYQHLEIVHGILDTKCKFKCIICKKKYSTKEKCDDHVVNAHKDDKPRPHVCMVCGARFTLGWHLKGHQKTVHSDERPFSCALCSYQGKTPQSMKNHQLSHQDPAEYSLKCGFCDATFRDRPYLKKHVRKIHNSDDIFFCSNCSNGFSQQKDLQLHMSSCR